MVEESDRYKSILLFGMPGSGKGTQGVVLGQLPDLVHVSCGDIFRRLPKYGERCAREGPGIEVVQRQDGRGVRHLSLFVSFFSTISKASRQKENEVRRKADIEESKKFRAHSTSSFDRPSTG